MLNNNSTYMLSVTTGLSVASSVVSTSTTTTTPSGYTLYI